MARLWMAAGAVAILVGVVLGCSDSVNVDKDGSIANPPVTLPPDAGGSTIVLPACNALDDPTCWACDSLVAHCTQAQPDVPDGQSTWVCWDDASGTTCLTKDSADFGGGWICSQDENGTHCTLGGPGAPDGDPGWACAEVGGEWVCQHPSDDHPDLQGEWDCVGGGGMTCTYGGPGTPDDQPGWACLDDPAEGWMCLHDQPDHPEIGGGWTCSDVPEGGLICHYRGFDLPDGQPGWACTESPGEGIVCTHPTSGHTDIGAGWDCSPDPAGGERCVYTGQETPDGRPGWSCVDIPAEGLVCTDPEGSQDHPDLPAGWACQDTDQGYVCTDPTPEFPGQDPAGWTCTTDEFGRHCEGPASSTGDDPIGNPSWTCQEVAGEGVICHTDTPDTPDGSDIWDCEFTDAGRVCDRWLCDEDQEVCTKPFPDRPDGVPGWDCHDSPSEGLICEGNIYDHPDANGNPLGGDDPSGGQMPQDWECEDGGDDTIRCVNDDPDTPDDQHQWDCFEDPSGRHCTQVPQVKEDASVPVYQDGGTTAGDDVPSVHQADGPLSGLDVPVAQGTDGSTSTADFDPGSCPVGAVTGRICVPSQNDLVWLVNADVWVDVPAYCGQPAGRVSTQTDQEGQFLLENLPPGSYAVQAQKGSFSANYNIDVQPGVTAEIPADDNCIYIDPTTEIAVVTGSWDEIEVVLERLGLDYDLYRGGNMDARSRPGDNAEAIDLLTDYDLMLSYDIIFFNCGTNWDGIFTGPNSGLIQTHLHDYVMEGGSIYASDWDYMFVEAAFPERIDFLGEDMGPLYYTALDRWDDVLLGMGYMEGENDDFFVADNLYADVFNAGLATFLGSNMVAISYDLPQWSVIQGVGADVQIQISGDVQYTEYIDGWGFMGPVREVPDLPLLVSFSMGEGEVVFTTFHYHSQMTQDINDVLSYLIFEL